MLVKKGALIWAIDPTQPDNPEEITVRKDSQVGSNMHAITSTI